MSNQGRPARAWAIVRERVGAAPEYFGGLLACPPDGFTANLERAYHFTHRKTARDNWRSMGLTGDRRVRIVPIASALR